MAKEVVKDNLREVEIRIAEELDKAYGMAEDYFSMLKGNKAESDSSANGIATKHIPTVPPFVADNLNREFIVALEDIARLCEKASTGYLNVITGLAIKATLGDKVDVRYHQRQIQKKTDRPAGFNFRGVSESVIYHWMEKHEFHGAKSGWQTRTFERPKPYLLSYDENIGAIKHSFLTAYDQIETHGQDAKIALAFLLLRRIELREKSKIILAIPKIQDIMQITNLFSRHFFYSYKDSKGGSRLPVLALHSVYVALLSELSRYKGKTLKPLELHSAADLRTGSIGDIEVYNADGSIFEAVEVKHMIPITKELVDVAKQKIRGSQVDRYYLLTTYPHHELSEDAVEEIENVKRLLGCQMIANGVLSSIQYYLRLLSRPGDVLSIYANELETDMAIGFEHRDVWNKIATGTIK